MNEQQLTDLFKSISIVEKEHDDKIKKVFELAVGEFQNPFPRSSTCEFTYVSHDELEELLDNPVWRPQRFVTPQYEVDVDELRSDPAKRSKFAQTIAFANELIGDEMAKSFGMGPVPVRVAPIRIHARVEGFTLKFYFHVLTAYTRTGYDK